MNPAETKLPDWQRGIPLEKLKPITAIFRAWDKGLALGAFSQIMDRDIASAIADGELVVYGASDAAPEALALTKLLKKGGTMLDFTGFAAAFAEPGDLRITRFASAGAELSAVKLLSDCSKGKRAWLEVWEESERDKRIARAAGFVWSHSRILGSSEVRGVWCKNVAELPRSPMTLKQLRLDSLCLSRLKLPSPELVREWAGKAKQAVGIVVKAWADHYSTYNVGKTWTAVAVRGFGGLTDFIEKPREMPRAWKQENPDKLEWQLADTPLRAQLPELEPLIALVPGVKHRIRLMRLAAKTGLLERHADIVDPDCGTEAGQTLRIHLPLQTNKAVAFESWGQRGEHFFAHMAEGEAWYLDTRKPHRARNQGDSDRVHLVMDVESCPELVAMLSDNPPEATL